MKFSRLSLDSIRPRPARGAEVALGIHEEEDDGIEFDPRRDISKKDWEGMREELEGFRGTNWWAFSHMAMRLSLLFPDRKAELNLNNTAFEGMKGRLEKCRGMNGQSFSRMAMRLSLLFPDRKRELNLDDKDFEGMKGKLEEFRSNGDWWNFSYIAMNLSVLAAERAEIVNGQIVITNKKPKLTREPKPLPVRSNIA